MAKSRGTADRTYWIFWGIGTYGVLSLISMATMSIGAAIAGASVVAALGGAGFFRELKRNWADKDFRLYVIASALLIGACLLSLLAALVAPVEYAGKHAELEATAVSKLWYFVIPVVVGMGVKKLPDAKRSRIVRAWLITAGVAGVIGVIQFFTGWPRPQMIPNGGYYHATIFFGHHLSTASILIFPFFAALDLFARKDGARWVRLPRWLLGAFVVLLLVTLVLTFSRMVWVAIPVTLLIWLFWRLPWKHALAITGALVLAGLAVTQTPVFQQRLDSAMGKAHRWMMWEGYWKMFQDRPVFGVGFRQTGEVFGNYEAEIRNYSIGSTHAHNMPLEMLAGTGAVGFAAWLVWSGFVFWLLLGQIRRRGKESLPFVVGFFCAWVALQLNGLTQVNFWEGKVMHQMMWSLSWILFGGKKG